MRERTAYTHWIKGEESKGGALQYNNTIRGYNQGRRGVFRGHKRGGFGRGRGPIICYNCNQLGHIVGDYLNPCTTCMYCRALDQATEDFP